MYMCGVMCRIFGKFSTYGCGSVPVIFCPWFAEGCFGWVCGFVIRACNLRYFPGVFFFSEFCAVCVHVVKKKNDFAVLCSIYVPDFGYLSKAFPVGATSIYLFDF